MLQLIVGMVSYLILKRFIPSLYPIFGAELEFAFAGGHGTIGILSSMLKERSILLEYFTRSRISYCNIWTCRRYSSRDVNYKCLKQKRCVNT